MFLGQFTIPLSGGNRMILPRKFRQDTEDNIIYLIEGLDGGIWGFNTQGWMVEASKRLREELTSTTGRRDRRIFFSSAESCSLDGQGRFNIPEGMVQRANLQEQILIIGAGDHFEIWNPEQYRKILESYDSIQQNRN